MAAKNVDKTKPAGQEGAGGRERSGEMWKAIEAIAKLLYPLVIYALGTTTGVFYDDLKIWDRLWDSEKEVLAKKTIGEFVESDNDEVRSMYSIILAGLKDERIMTQRLNEFVASRKQIKEEEPEDNTETANSVKDDKAIKILTEVDKAAQEKPPKKVVAPVLPMQGQTSSTNGTSTTLKAAKQKVGWVLLGRYDKRSKSWINKQFDFFGSHSPDQIKNSNKPIRLVKDEISVWDKPTSLFGVNGKLLCVLKQGSEMTVKDYVYWEGGQGFIWGKVAFQVDNDK